MTIAHYRPAIIRWCETRIAMRVLRAVQCEFLSLTRQRLTHTIPHPDSLPDALRTRREDFEREARLILALRLFELGRITSGQAADMAGIGRVDSSWRQATSASRR